MDLSAVPSALKTIGELTQQVTSLLGVDDQVESLERELRWMQSFLKLADARTVDNEVIRTSVAEIRELAYDAEDVVETFALKVASKRKCGFSNCIKRSACFLKEACLLHQTRSEIEKITSRIKELTRRLKTYDVAKLGPIKEKGQVLQPKGGKQGGLSLIKWMITLLEWRVISRKWCRFWWRREVINAGKFSWWKLQSSLGNLRCLQTLDLRIDQIVHVPNVIWRMEQLRYLYLPLKCNPKTKLKLATLRNLQTLVNFNSKICYVEDLINMTNLRDLVFRGSFKIKDFNEEELDKNPPIIEGRHPLSLSIISYDGGIDPRHLNHLLSSCLSLCKLNLDAEIGELPKYDHLSSDLAYITLSRCNLEEDPIPTLEKLPNLRILELYDKASRANKIFCSAQDFPKLESLRITQFFNLEELNVDEGAMPCLWRLEIVQCSQLKMVPDGLRFTTTLRELKIEKMPKAFKDRVEEGGEDFYKVQHIPSIIFRDCDN
ncbi:hypothetical protein GQ457_06G024010 [Hibiscus cannabinus]